MTSSVKFSEPMTIVGSDPDAWTMRRSQLRVTVAAVAAVGLKAVPASARAVTASKVRGPGRVL